MKKTIPALCAAVALTACTTPNHESPPGAPSVQTWEGAETTLWPELGADLKPGHTARLTIRDGLQSSVEGALKAHGNHGEAVLMDARTGEVLAMVGGLKAHAVGSTFKPFSMLAALSLERLTLTPTDTVECKGTHEIDGRAWRCHKADGHGIIGLDRAMATSCNGYAFEIARQLTQDELVAFSRRFGLGLPTGIGVDEASGSVPMEAKIESYQQGHTLQSAVGHGPVSVTPLQLARAYAALATGSLADPHLVAYETDSNGDRHNLHDRGATPIKLDPDSLAMIRKGLVATVEDPEGTGHRASGGTVRFAGKTGTAQGLDGQHDAWFAGYAPIENPEVVVVVRVAKGGTGGRVAAPIAKTILEAWHARE